MGKILILTFSDAEEPIMDKILTAVEGEPTMEHISNPYNPSVLTFPNLEIRFNEQTVYHNNHPVPLTHHEFFTLLYLAQHPSWVLSKEQIYEAVWKADPEHCGAAVANVLCSLRRKIGEGYIRWLGVGIGLWDSYDPLEQCKEPVPGDFFVYRGHSDVFSFMKDNLTSNSYWCNI